MAATAARPGDRAARPIRVAYCIDSMSESGGTELHAVRTVEQLDRTRVEPMVLTLNARGGMADRYARAGVTVREFPITSLFSAATWRRQGEAAAFLRDARVDVLHAHDLYSNFFFGLAAQRARTPVVVASKRWTRQPNRKYFVTDVIAYRLADRVLANSVAVAQSLQEVEHISSDKVFVLENFLEPEVFAPIDRTTRDARRAALGLGQRATTIGIVARLRSEKDHATLVRAFRRLVSDGADVELAVVGDGPEEPALRALADSLGIADRVHFLGHLASRPLPHALFDISVLCSLHEGFPNSVIESMAAGTPVVATAVGGIPGILDDGRLGALVPPGDDRALANAIAMALGDRDALARRADTARVAVAERFGAAAHLDRLIVWYASLLQARPQHEVPTLAAS